MIRFAPTALILSLILAASAAIAAEAKMSLRSNDVLRSYYLFVPEEIEAHAPAPLLVLLHGSHETGATMVRAWRQIAAEENIVLAAPNARDQRFWQLRMDGPRFIRDVVEDVETGRAIDRHRIYLFGFSGGAEYALTLAMLESRYFAAVALYAGAWRNARSAVLAQRAGRKIPVFIAASERDRFFPLSSVQSTEKALRAADHPFKLMTLPRHGHSYSDVAATVNQAAWEFLKSMVLSDAPQFQNYD